MAESDGEGFGGFLSSPDTRGVNMDIDRRLENVERKIGTIVLVQQRLDSLAHENEEFRKQVLILTSQNAELLKDKVELENKNALLGKRCEELQVKITEMELKLKEGEEKGKQMDVKLNEVKSNNEAAHTNFREIMKQQEKEKSVLAQKEVVKVLQQEEKMVRNIAEKKKSVVISGLVEDKERKWQERKIKEEEKIQNVLGSVLGEENAVGVVEDYQRLGKYEEGKSRPVKVTLRSQLDAESVLRNSWKLKNSQETNMIYVRRNMSQEERSKMREMVAQVKEKNEQRNEEEKNEFFWKIRHDKVWKWWIKGKE